jgi:hypothetical protein
MGIPSGYVSGQVIQAVVGVGKILQVVSADKADSFTSTTASFIDVTGLSVSITPSATTSKILVFATVAGSVAGGSGDGIFRLVRDATAIAVGTSGSSVNGFASVSQAYPNAIFSNVVTFLDSPATTSATTYKVQVYAATSTTYVNRRGADALFGGFSSITVMEVSA